MNQAYSAEDYELLNRCVAGDAESAFTELVTRYRTSVHAVCVRILGNTPDSDDATQLVFLALLQKSHTIQHPVSVAGWLHQTAHFVALQLLQSVRLRAAREASAVRPFAPSVLEDWQQTRAMLLQELHALPDRYRVPLTLHYLEGQSQHDVARALSCTYGTVSGRLSRARALLRERLVQRGIAIPVAALTLLAPSFSYSAESEAHWHASLGTAQPSATTSGTRTMDVFSHIYAPLCMVLTICWFAGLIR
jgi:RNA polymerase sigma factor (sigma-70 family)